MDHKYSLINPECFSTPFLDPWLSLCWLPRTLGHIALGDHSPCMPISNFTPAQDDETILFSLLVSKQKVRTGKDWQGLTSREPRSPQIWVHSPLLHPSACSAHLGTVTLQKEGRIQPLSPAPSLSQGLPCGLQTASAPKGGALGKWLFLLWLWLGCCGVSPDLVDLPCLCVPPQVIDYGSVSGQQMPPNTYFCEEPWPFSSPSAPSISFSPL